MSNALMTSLNKGATEALQCGGEAGPPLQMWKPWAWCGEGEGEAKTSLPRLVTHQGFGGLSKVVLKSS